MSEILIYEIKNQVHVEVTYEDDSLWLNLNQVSELFGRDKSVISRHLRNIFSTNELDRESVVAKNATTASDGKTYQVEYFNLDAIISVGYRVNSKRGTQFRIWANSVLKDYLVKGYSVNEKRLKEKVEQLEELKKVVQLQDKVISNYQLEGGEAEGLVKVIADYAYALDILDDYDHQRLQLPDTTSEEIYRIGYDEAKNAIETLGSQTNFKGLFGLEKDDSFKGSLENIYQTFDGKDLYPSLEEKAAHLLYFVTKNHSFSDGNKRIAAFLFIWFLEKNNLLLKNDGFKRIPDNALVALTLLIAESDPLDKDMMIKVVVNLLTEKKND